MNRKQKRHLKKLQGNPAVFFVRLCNKYLPNIMDWIDEFKDPRHTSYIIYSQRVMIATVLLKYVCGIISMTQMTKVFNDEAYIENIGTICREGKKLDEIPHFVTINEYLSELNPSWLEELQTRIVKELIRGRGFESARYNKQWLVIVDATGACSFNYENDGKCLHSTFKKGTADEYTVYSHKFLEAKIILGDHLVISIATEPIENNAEDLKEQEGMGVEAVKQDCELKAFKRLAKKLKTRFPRLPICIMGDSLYANESLFAICNEKNWNYIIRFKDGSMPSVAEEFHSLKDREKENQYKDRKWVSGIATATRTLNVVEWIDGATVFQWITNMEITRGNVIRLTETGRMRWKIENEGFNNQKNHRFDLEHVCCHNYNAIKNHYLLVQVADTLRQLYELRAYIDKNLEVVIKNISSDLLAHFGRILTIYKIILYQMKFRRRKYEERW